MRGVLTDASTPEIMVPQMTRSNEDDVSVPMSRLACEKLKVPELKNILKKQNLKVSGKKNDLIDRLLESQNKTRKLFDPTEDPSNEMFIAPCCKMGVLGSLMVR